MPYSLSPLIFDGRARTTSAPISTMKLNGVRKLSSNLILFRPTYLFAIYANEDAIGSLGIIVLVLCYLFTN